MKKITQKQIETITQAFFDLNAPIKLYVGIKDLLEKLPDCEDKCEEKEVEYTKKDLKEEYKKK